ncbi:MAG: alkaline phosphatase family protein [Thaumarchaeota archaeon]|nr:alkaline phosphatase family protein [Nitrososphaerota archaeon]
MLPPGAVKPDYQGYCLSNIPSTAVSLLGVDGGSRVLPDDVFSGTETSGIDNVVLMLFDGLGYKEWVRQAGSGFIGSLTRKGNVRPITTVFPSTTAAALTTISTGLTPQEHGLPEWYVYMQEVGEVIVTLPFSRASESGRDTLVGAMDPRDLFEGETIFERLKASGVGSVSFTNRYLADSAYSKVSRRGAEVVPYMSASDLSVALRRNLEESRGRKLFYVYWSYVDTIEHVFGPNTEEASVEASLVSHAFQEGFLSRLSREAARRTIIIATADHGQLNVNPEETLYLNRYRKLVRSLNLAPSGARIPPWGSARDAYLSVRDDRLDETESYLSKKLEGIASVMRTDEALNEGLFGLGKPSKKFLRRIGNLMILPHGTNTVWYRYKKKDALDLKGHHGGLTRDEMTVPLATARLSDIQ